MIKYNQVKRAGEKMKQKMINKKKYTASCSNCLYGRTPKDKTVVLCSRKGIVEADSTCRHYKYDPLKRIPNRIVIQNDFKKEDFEI